jgi:hypothetical protein
MGSVIRTVSLDAETAKRASEMDNFSLYIRECLSGHLHLQHEALKRKIKTLESVILIARDHGSMSPAFRKAVADMVIE